VFRVVLFLQPSAAATGPAGAPFMAELLGKRKLPSRIIELGTITVVAGLILYWIDWHDYPTFGDWISTRFGVALTVGALCAITALGLGIFITRPNVQRLFALGQQVAASGGPPSPEQAAEMGTIQHRLKVWARVGFGFLIVAVLLMSTASHL
jgi:hypothetical protein